MCLCRICLCILWLSSSSLHIIFLPELDLFVLLCRISHNPCAEQCVNVLGNIEAEQFILVYFSRHGPCEPFSVLYWLNFLNVIVSCFRLIGHHRPNFHTISGPMVPGKFALVGYGYCPNWRYRQASDNPGQSQKYWMPKLYPLSHCSSHTCA